MDRLDRTGERIVGVLIEKQLSVPDSYPLSENALLAGCNQSSNRDPVLDLAQFQVHGALMALQETEWVARVEGGGRVPRFRHRVEERLGVGGDALPVLAELLLRGPQAPGALKPRVARMGFAATPDAIEAVLRDLAAHHPPLVEQLPLGPRERDRRWRHLIGDASATSAVTEAAASGMTAVVMTTDPTPSGGTAAAISALEARVAALEQQVAEMARKLASLQTEQMGN